MNLKEIREEEYLFPFIFTNSISKNELNFVMNNFIEEENYEKCNLIKNLIDKKYFNKKEERKELIVDDLFEVIKLVRKLEKIKKDIENGEIEHEKAISILEDIKKNIESYNKKVQGLTVRDIIEEINFRIKKAKKSKCPFKLFSSERRMWKECKKEAINQLEGQKENVIKYFKI